MEIVRSGKGILLSGEEFSDGESWLVEPVSSGTFLLQKDDAGAFRSTEHDGFARCSVGLMSDFLSGLHQRQFNGCVSVDTGVGVKRLYFRSGEICFAASNLIDDRLGEVIYRAGMISLDQMTDAAVKVNRETKFGKVLLNSGLFNSVDLWDALKLQVYEILQSIFLVDQVSLKIETSKGTAPTEVVFEQGTEFLLDEIFSVGIVIRDFKSRVNESGIIRITEKGDDVKQEHTFYGDILQMIDEKKTMKEVIKASKLQPINTYRALHAVVQKQYIEVDEDDGGIAVSLGGSLREIKSRLDAYEFLLRIVKKEFEADNSEFPTFELLRFIHRFRTQGAIGLYLSSDGSVPRECLVNLFCQANASKTLVERIVLQLDSLIQFLLQLSGDMLPYQRGRAVRDSYAELT